MCGIAGVWSNKSGVDIKDIIIKMTKALLHRGPNDQGNWIDSEINLALGQSRLSIIELSELGHQPMISSNKRWVMVFNGEVYNYKELRNEVIKESSIRNETISFRGNSDTEVVLEAISLFGVREALSKMIGMFAIAIYDRKEKELYLVRDRMGEKPLYYGHTNGVFFFCSELKSIYNSGVFGNSLDNDAISLFFRYEYIPAPYTIFSGICKLIPGTFLKISDFRQPLNEPEPYWSLLQISEENQNQQFDLSEKELLEKLEGLLKQSIKGQMVADVPVGAFLSGGIDSSLIAALMQSLNNNPINTFSIGFYEKKYNEAEYAKKVAEVLKTNHTEMYVSSEEALRVIPDLPKIYCEPFSDTSMIPTYLVSKLAKQKVTVSLSGDAGDELFGGYKNYVSEISRWSELNRIPKPLKKLYAKLMNRIPVNSTNKIWDILSLGIPDKFKFKTNDDKIRKLGILKAEDFYELYKITKYPSSEVSKLLLNSNDPRTIHNDDRNKHHFKDYLSMMMIMDMLCYLPDNNLVKVDRAAMAVSLETRIPFLDHRVVEFSLQIPSRYKIKDGKTKWPLRQILYKYVPKELIERPKKGFSPPVNHWLRNNLRDWAETLLDDKLIKEQGLLNSELVRKLWNEHLSDTNSKNSVLWSILMFQSWLMENKKYVN